MKVSVAIFAVLLGLTTAAVRDRRQAVCPDPFQNVPSPCSSAPNTQFYFPHPTDNTKFLQCDIYKRMYIIQCPQGELYDSSVKACRPPAVATAAPYVPPVNVVTQPPQTQAPVIGFNNGNPCVQTVIARGLIYFPVAGDKTRFIECDLAGNPITLSCPTGLLWDQGMLSCVYPINTGTTGGNTGGAGSTTNLGFANPCTTAAISSGHYFFPHPTSSTKFLQCNQYGQVFQVDCPSGLIWKPASVPSLVPVNKYILISQPLLFLRS